MNVAETVAVQVVDALKACGIAYFMAAWRKRRRMGFIFSCRFIRELWVKPSP